MPILAICSLLRSFKLQTFGHNWRSRAMGTDRTKAIATTRPNLPRADSVKRKNMNVINKLFFFNNKTLGILRQNDPSRYCQFETVLCKLSDIKVNKQQPIPQKLACCKKKVDFINYVHQKVKYVRVLKWTKWYVISYPVSLHLSYIHFKS